MPSWNIHIAHTERLFEQVGVRNLGIDDANAFLGGMLAPDIYVGYMVPDASMRIDYRLTHLARVREVPIPDYQMFWEFYVERALLRGTRPSDFTLGAWAHLVCDSVYNRLTRDRLDQIGRPQDRQARMDKQGDFDLYGKTLDISLVPVADDAALEQARSFQPYSILERDMRRALEVAQAIVENNQKELELEGIGFALLDSDFFVSARDEAHETIVQGLRSIRWR